MAVASALLLCLRTGLVGGAALRRRRVGGSTIWVELGHTISELELVGYEYDVSSQGPPPHAQAFHGCTACT